MPRSRLDQRAQRSTCRANTGKTAMFSVFFYILVSLCLFGPISYYCDKRYRQTLKKKFAWCAWIAVAAPFAPYLLVDLQTAVLGPSLLPAVRYELRQDDWTTNIASYRVLAASPVSCTVYVVTPCSLTKDRHGRYVNYIGELVKVDRHRGIWKADVNDEDAAWSDCGSADSNVFPPYADGGGL